MSRGVSDKITFKAYTQDETKMENKIILYTDELIAFLIFLMN